MKQTIKNIKHGTVIMLISLMLPGCELMGPDTVPPFYLEPEIQEEEIVEDEIAFEQLQNKQFDKEEANRNQAELFRGSDRFIASDLPGDKTSKARSDKGKYTLNFDDADLGEVAKVILSDTLGMNYVMNPKVSGNVTLQTSQPLTREELLPTLEMLLSMNNAALVKNGNLYNIEPIGESVGGTPLKIGKKVGQNASGYQARIVPLEYVGVKDMVEILKPLTSEKAILRVDQARNLLMIAGTSRELDQIMEIISTFDVDVMQGMSFGIFPLVHVNAEQIIAELDQILFDQDNAPLAGMLRFLAIERLNSVLVITPQSIYLDKAQTWISRLDKATFSASGGVMVYRVQNVDAEELANTLNSIFTGSSRQRDDRVSLAPGATPAEITNRQDREAESPERREQPSQRSRSGRRNTVSIEELEDVNVIADRINNSLIIVATPQQFDSVMNVIKQLDVMPLQVLIDATIVEVTLNDDLEYGIKWFIESGDFRAILGGFNGSGTDSDGEIINPTHFFNPFSGFTALVTGTNVKAVLKALANETKVNVIASPSLMVLNNQEASLNVGDRVPIATSQQTNTNSVDAIGGGVVSNNIEMVDTGVTLNVKPRVNAGGLVIMEIEQEANQAVATTTSDLDTPTIQQRKITSVVAVKSGETIVLGGLIREQYGSGVDGVPFLSTLPLIGPLFGTTTKTMSKTELVVLITPRVVQTTRDARQITNEFKRKLTGIYEELSRLEDMDSETFEAGY